VAAFREMVLVMGKDDLEDILSAVQDGRGRALGRDRLRALILALYEDDEDTRSVLDDISKILVDR